MGNSRVGDHMTVILKPLNDRIVVKRIKEQDVSEGGIIIPDAAKEKPQEAIVIAVGTGRVKEDGTCVPMNVKAGDRVLFSKYSGAEVTINNEEHLILREDDVFAIVETIDG